MNDPNSQFVNLNLHIEKAADKNTFQVSAQDDAGNVQARHTFQYYVDRFILSKLEDSVGRNIPQNSALIQDFGQELYHAVFGGEILGYYQALGKGNQDIRLKLFFKPEDAELLRIPWEFLFDGTNFLSAYPRITMSRVLEGVAAAKRDPIEGKIKILAVVSSPLDLKDHHRLNIEQEQVLILQALDRPDAANQVEVEFLDEASVKNIQAKLDEEEYHILHYSGHGVYEDRGYLLLEDDAGNSRGVDNETVANLLAGYQSLRLVVLSGCQTAKTSGRQALSDLATPLLRKGIPSVVAMQYSVADRSAIELAQKLYSEIANNTPIDLALTRARKELLLTRGNGAVDFATPVLYGNDPDCLAVKEVKAKAKRAGLMAPRPVTIKPNVDLRIERLGNQFIGRRRQLRRIKEDYFVRGIRVVVLHGIGGIGKTVTAAQVAERLMDHFDGLYAFECQQGLKPEKVLLQLNEFLKRIGVNSLEGPCTDPDIPFATKINYLAQVLSQVKLLVIFDNFESLLSVDKDSREITDPELKKALKALVNQCKNGSRFLFTCRYTFNLTDGRLTNLIDELNLGELSRPEAIMVMNRFPDIAGEDFSTKLRIFDTIGGHPYTINIFGLHANRTSTQDVLTDIAGVQKEMVEFTLLDRSYNKLSESARNLIDHAAAYKKAVPLSGLEWFGNHGGQPANITSEIDELTHWGLIIKIEEEQAVFQVHTLVKDFIRDKAGKDEWKQRLVKAGQYHENRVEETGSVWDLLDARELYFDAGEYNKAGDIVAGVMEPLHRSGLIELVRGLNEQTIDTATGRTKAAALHHLGMIHQAQGDYDRALEKYNQSMKIEEELGEKSGLAATLHQLGLIHQAQGDYDQALEKYNRSMKIHEELGNKSGIAAMLHQLGMIHQAQGNYAQAIEKYNQSMKIEEELGEKSGLAATLHQLGLIHQAQGDYDQAIEKYNQSMKIEEELGNKSGIVKTLHQLGNIFYRKGDYDQALEKYNQSMKIREELSDNNGIAESLAQIGKVHQANGEFKEALKCYLISASIFEQLKSPYLELVKKDINSLKEQIGEEAFEKHRSEIISESEGEGNE